MNTRIHCQGDCLPSRFAHWRAIWLKKKKDAIHHDSLCEILCEMTFRMVPKTKDMVTDVTASHMDTNVTTTHITWSQNNVCAILHSFNFNVEWSKINVPAPQASHSQPYKKGRKRVHEETQVIVKFIAPISAFTRLHHYISMHHRTPISCKRYKLQTCSYHKNRLKWWNRIHVPDPT